jgi:hypothetical protein
MTDLEHVRVGRATVICTALERVEGGALSRCIVIGVQRIEQRLRHLSRV